MINTQIDWQKKIVGQHILSYVLNAITDKSSTHELEKFSLTDYKISDIEYLSNMKENGYRILITSIFGNDKFINEITVTIEYNCPTLKMFTYKEKQISTSSSSSNIEKSSSSSI